MKDNKGQALIEMCIIAPVMILMLWGIWRLHTSAFFKARAEMAARHAAWFQSVKDSDSWNERSAVIAQSEVMGKAAFYEYGPLTDVTVDIENDTAFLITEWGSPAEAIDGLSGGFLSKLGGFIKDLFAFFPLYAPFVTNAESTVTYTVNTPLFDPPLLGNGNTSAFTGDAYAFFPIRCDALYFHNMWDLVPNLSDLFSGPPMDDGEGGNANDSADDVDQMIEEFETTLEENKDNIDEDAYEHYQEQLREWKEWAGYI